MIAQLFLSLVPQAQTPNVLIVIADDVGRSERHLMPNLEALAARGTSMERAYAWPVCSPTRHAALFGLLPRRSGLGDICNADRPQTSPSPYPNRLHVSLAEALKPHHATAAFGKWHLGRPLGLVGSMFIVESSPFVNGFDVFRAGTADSIATPSLATGYYLWEQINNGSRGLSTVYATDAQVSEFTTWWTTQAGPKLGWLAFNAAHAPYDPPPGRIATGNVRGDYEQVVVDLDRALGSVLSVVDLANTFVVYLADNGTPDEARPIGTPAGHFKGTTYEGGIRVPLVVAGPGVRTGRSKRLVSMVDLPATVLDLLALESRGFTDSLSFADELGAFKGDPARSWVFSERYDAQVTGADDQAIVELEWKLRVVDPDGPGVQPVEQHLYYLPSDPRELNPVDPLAAPVVARRMLSRLATLNRDVPRL